VPGNPVGSRGWIGVRVFGTGPTHGPKSVKGAFPIRWTGFEKFLSPGGISKGQGCLRRWRGAMIRYRTDGARPTGLFLPGFPGLGPPKIGGGKIPDSYGKSGGGGRGDVGKFFQSWGKKSIESRKTRWWILSGRRKGEWGEGFCPATAPKKKPNRRNFLPFLHKNSGMELQVG